MKYHFAKIYERGKWRKLCYQDLFPDGGIQHALFNVIASLLHITIPTYSYAGIKGRGTHKCRRDVEKHLKKDRKNTKYAGLVDVYHYFESVDRQMIFDMCKRKLKDCRVLELLHRIIFECPGKRGLKIGLYSAQILSTYFLSGLDRLYRALGFKGFRYMDDIVIFSNSKNKLHRMIEIIREYLHNINLRLKGNYAVFPIAKRRLGFIGYAFNHFGVMIRKRTKISYMRSCNKIVKALKKHEEITPHMMASMISYQGIVSWASDCGKGLISKYSNRVDIALEFGVDAI